MKNRSNVRKKDKENRRGRRRRLMLGLALVGLFGVAVTGAYKVYPYVSASGRKALERVGPVKEIIVEGTRRLSGEEVAEMVRPSDEGMVSLDLERAVATLQTSPWIEKAEIRKEMPGRLRVRIKEREPVALLEKGGKLYYLDADGNPIEALRSEEVPFLPLVRGREAYPVPASVVELVEALDARKVMTRCESLEIRVRDGNNLVMNIDGVAVKLGEGDFPRKLDRWFAIEPEILKRKVEVDHVDLRYSNKVIVSPLNRKGAHG